MSCVVTNRWSDWSTQSWSSNKLALRVHKINDDYVVSDRIVTFFSSYLFLSQKIIYDPCSPCSILLLHIYC